MKRIPSALDTRFLFTPCGALEYVTIDALKRGWFCYKVLSRLFRQVFKFVL